jgi:predicted amidohydrolase
MGAQGQLMRLAAFQMVAKTGDVAANLAMVEAAVIEAKARGAELLVAPELATTGYGPGDAMPGLADAADGAQPMALAAMARTHGIALVAGFPERANDVIYNSAIFAMPDGRQAIYRKCQLYGRYEHRLFKPGEDAPKLTTYGGFRLGVLICYDVEFPEMVRHLALSGADAVLVPTAQPDTPDAPFIAGKVIPVRAFENGIAIVYADHAGADGRFGYAGRSCIAFPDGSDGARAAPTGSAVIVADYDPASFEAARAANPYLKDRRADLL